MPAARNADWKSALRKTLVNGGFFGKIFNFFSNETYEPWPGFHNHSYRTNAAYDFCWYLQKANHNFHFHTVGAVSNHQLLIVRSRKVPLAKEFGPDRYLLTQFEF